jgi:hypothetical protein
MRHWRNLHDGAEPKVEVRLALAGDARSSTLTCTWPGDDVTAPEVEFKRPGPGRRTFEGAGWDRALNDYRPFLSTCTVGRARRACAVCRRRWAPVLRASRMTRPPSLPLLALFTGFDSGCSALREAPGPRRVRRPREATAPTHADEAVAAPGRAYELPDAPAVRMVGIGGASEDVELAGAAHGDLGGGCGPKGGQV